MRDRFGMILDSLNMKSIIRSMGQIDNPVIQNGICEMNDLEFEEFIALTTTPIKRREIFNSMLSKLKHKEKAI